jgi:hypothetical protein
MKKCGKCNTIKPLDAFGKDRNRKSGLTSACKECRNPQSKSWRDKNPERVKETNRSSKLKRKEYYSAPDRKMKYRNSYLKKSFGITHEQYQEILVKQGGVCAICKKYRLAPNRLFMPIDHCHTTGKIRGILCNGCNQALGIFEDSRDLLENAIQYLNDRRIS